MKRLFWFLVDGCWHEWESFPHLAIDHYERSFGPRDFMYRSIPCRCKNCGKISDQKDRSGGMA